MRVYAIRSYATNYILHEGYFPSFAACVEDAVQKRIDLGTADFRNKNLANTNLDDARMSAADFTNSNLAGANLSESALDRAVFQNASLHNICLAFSSLVDADFRFAQLGGADVAGADISGAIFSPPACTALDFMAARIEKPFMVETPDGTRHKTFRPPLVLTGLDRYPLVYLGDTLVWGAGGTQFAKCNLRELETLLHGHQKSINSFIKASV